MNVTEALQKRKSIRAFLSKEISQEQILRIMDAAKYTPSGVNTQPWQVVAISGGKKAELQKLIESAFNRGEKGEMDYRYYPLKWSEPYKSRRMACGLQLYSVLEISRQDKERRLEQWAANFRAFDAPVMLLFFMDSSLETGSYMDYGMFLQSVMLTAVEEGLATCPQAALGEYPKIVKKFLGYPDESILICGMALGYEDTEAIINSYRTPREPADSFTRFVE